MEPAPSPVVLEPEVGVDEYADERDPERGDVPGWVLVTLMTAGLVVLLWGVAGPALTGLFSKAVASVSGL